MTLASLGMTKVILISTAVVGSTVAALHIGNLQGLTNAFGHVPTWTHAHGILSGLMKNR